MRSNELYLTVLPLIHFGKGLRLTEQCLTLFPDKRFATEFFQDEVEGYITTFTNYQSTLTGGHVTGYDIQKEPTTDGRVIVRVVQHVA